MAGAPVRDKVRWGVLGAARIAVNKVIPAMQQCTGAEITAIASRDLAKARAAADGLGIPKAYRSYAELVADPEIDAIYNPLPTDLHVPWSIRAAEAGKHVLCEKPLAMNAGEVRDLIAARDRCGVQIAEAFMVKVNPRWQRVFEIVASGEIGEVRSMYYLCGYDNLDAANIRNHVDLGGGALFDIGCYGVFFARHVFGREPVNVAAAMDRDPRFGTDRLVSALMNFGSGHAVFTCGTQMNRTQSAEITGSKGRIEIEYPLNPLPDVPVRIVVYAPERRVESFEFVNQFTLQGEAFSRAVRGEGQVPVPLEDSERNMRVIDALFRAAETGAAATL
jgi:predicted dehydrogenase